MDVPTWAYDDILAAASPGALRLALALYRHGSPQVDAAGRRRAYWRGSKPALARLARISKRTADAAVLELADAGLVTVHRVTLPAAGIALSALVHRDGGATFAPPSESDRGDRGATFAPPSRLETDPIHDDGVNPDPSPEREEITTTTMPGATFAPLFEQLAAAGVTNPAHWLNDFGAARCQRALYALDHARTSGDIQNPAGFMRHLLSSRAPLPHQPPQQPAPIDDEIRRYIGGFEHVAHYR